LDDGPGRAEGPNQADSLPSSGLFQLLDEHSRELVASAASLLHFEHGQTVLEQGQYVDQLYIVASGRLRVHVPDRHGLPFEVARYSPGDYYGEMSFLRGDRASATVEAATAATVWAIPHTVLGEVSERNPAIMREFAGAMAGRLSATNERFRQLRPGRSLGCISARTPLSIAFVRAVCRSAAAHLQRPVLVIDLAGGIAAEDMHLFTPIETALLDRRSLSEHDRFAERAQAAVGVVPCGSDGAIDAGALLDLISAYQTRYGLVLVCGSPAVRATLDLFDDLEGPIAIREANGRDDDWANAPAGDGVGTVLISEQPLAPRTQAGSQAPVRAVVAGVSDLATLRPAGEIGRSVDWVARHILRRKVGLALGAGGAKGYAHLGVIDGLAALGVPVDFVAGSSIGAPIAAAVAARMPTRELRRLLDQTFARALRPTIPIQSFLSNRSLRQDLEHIAAGRTFEELPLPLAIVAVDLVKRSEVVFRTGDVATAIVASMAIPGIFPPLRWRGRQLVDGGLLNPIPNRTVAQLGADIVIGVKLTSPVTLTGPVARRRTLAFRAPPIIDTIQAAFEVMQWKITEDGSARADVTVEPHFHGATGLRDFGRGDEFIAAGRAAVLAAESELKALLPWAK
jgi:NTE family protein